MQIYLGGSRHYISTPGPASLIQAVLHTGAQVHVGCCVGTDQAVIQAASRSSSYQQVRVFAAWGPGGQGAVPTLSAIQSVQAWAAAGGAVTWWAGGGLNLPLAARLIQRSQAALSGSSIALVIEPGPGSLAVAAHAVTGGMRVYAWSPSQPLHPAGHAGQWRASELLGSPVWLWQPAQLQLI